MNTIEPTVSLPGVTLVAATSVAIPATLHAMQSSMQKVRFGKALLLSDTKPPSPMMEGIEWRCIAPLRSRSDYSAFMLGELTKYISSDFALIVQWDGYVLNAGAWEDGFLNFDYIGAPWPQFSDEMTVGNGGFSLRSKRLIEASAEIPIPAGVNEDIALCRIFREKLEKEHDIRFAPQDVACRFSFERTVSTGQEFGFHGIFNLMKLLSHRQLANLLANLEPGVLGYAEAGEVMRWAASRGQLCAFFHALRGRFSARRSKQIDDHLGKQEQRFGNES